MYIPPIREGNTLIELNSFERWCQITTEGDIHLLFSYGTLEEPVNPEEVEEMAEKVVDIADLEVLGEDEVRLAM